MKYVQFVKAGRRISWTRLEKAKLHASRALSGDIVVVVLSLFAKILLVYIVRRAKLQALLV